jgi:hypothetical protein
MAQNALVQNALTVIIPIKPTQVANLRQLLETIGNNIKANPHLDWEASPSTHFARFVILDPASDPIPSLAGCRQRLLFTSNHDGDFQSYMEELVTIFGAGMEPLWSCCEGYPAGASTNVSQFAQFIQDHSHPTATFYIAYRGVPVATMWESIKVRQALNELADSPAAQEILRKLCCCVPRPAPNPNPIPPPAAPSASRFDTGSFLERLVGIRPGNNPNRLVVSPDKQVGVEDRVVQNQMTVIVPIRRGLKAWFLIRAVLWVVNWKARGANGSLAGLTTIHFARWAIIDGGRNLFFESNFDGSWENYIDDFVDFASLGMNLIWGNCVGFPRGGCKDIEWFKQYIRANQIPAQVFYSAYPESSVKNNLNDLQIGRAVRQFLREEEIDLFLQGSYNRGVSRALRIPLQPLPSQTAAATTAAATALPKKQLSPLLAGLLGIGALALFLARRQH